MKLYALPAAALMTAVIFAAPAHAQRVSAEAYIRTPGCTVSVCSSLHVVREYDTNSTLTYLNGTGPVATPGVTPRAEVNRTSSISSARSYADLTSGKMGLVAATSAGGFAEGRASWNDRVTFTVAGANASTLTRVKAKASLHAASMMNAGIGYRFADAAFSANSSFDSGFSMFMRSLTDVYYAENRPGNRAFSSWVDGDTRHFEWEFDILGASAFYIVEGSLFGQAWDGGSTDLINTARVSLVLPQGVSFTSGSGDFLTAVGGVPEPDTWAMLIAGFGLVGAVSRRRHGKTVAA